MKTFFYLILTGLVSTFAGFGEGSLKRSQSYPHLFNDSIGRLDFIYLGMHGKEPTENRSAVPGMNVPKIHAL